MANSMSAKKRVRVNARKAKQNLMVKSALKTTIKKFEVAIAEGNKEVATENFVQVTKALDMAASKNVIHKNKAAKKKSRLAAKLAKLA